MMLNVLNFVCCVWSLSSFKLCVFFVFIILIKYCWNMDWMNWFLDVGCFGMFGFCVIVFFGFWIVIRIKVLVCVLCWCCRYWVWYLLNLVRCCLFVEICCFYILLMNLFCCRIGLFCLILSEFSILFVNYCKWYCWMRCLVSLILCYLFLCL